MLAVAWLVRQEDMGEVSQPGIRSHSQAQAELRWIQ